MINYQNIISILIIISFFALKVNYNIYEFILLSYIRTKSIIN